MEFTELLQQITDSTSQIVAWLSSFIEALYSDALNPKKRLFWGYLASAGFIALVWLSWKRKSVQQYLFNRKIWWSSSARADYGLLIINKLLFAALSPYLLGQLAVATVLFEQLHQWFGRPALGQQWSTESIALAFTISLLLVDDFARFALHGLLHKVPFLWAFHKVHHSARTMTPLTVLRTHPVEGILFSLRGALVNGLVLAVFFYLFGDRVDLVTVLGANAFVFAFNVLGSNLRHSHVAIRYWAPLEKLVMSPAQHQVHHSTDPAHFDKNFGAILSIWDTLFGTNHPSVAEDLTFGVQKTVQKQEQNLLNLYLSPFKEAAGILTAIKFPSFRSSKEYK